MAKKQKPPGDGKDKKSEESKSSDNVASIYENGVTRTINLDKPEDISPEDVDRLTKAFGKFFEAEARREDLDPHIDVDDFQLSVNSKVKDAIKKYGDDEGVDLMAGFDTDRNKITMLFHPKFPMDANSAYRAMVKDGHYRFAGNEEVFGKYRGYHSVLDKDTIEQHFRRVDAEVRAMEALSREELLFNFVNAILSSDLATNHTAFVTTDQFKLVSPESQELLRDLVLFYMNAREHAKASMKGYEKVNKDFNANSIVELIEIPVAKEDRYPMRLEYAHIARSIRPKNYYAILQLIRALNAALPAKMQIALSEVIWAEHNIALDTSLANNRLVDPSKYLRKAFIAISRGYGTFEAFFTALNNFQQVLDQELNDKVTAARCLVAVYDSLGLNIAGVLKSSVRRILGELPF